MATDRRRYDPPPRRAPPVDPIDRGASNERTDLMDYHLRPVGKTCAATGRELRPGMRIHSVLVERDGQLARLDYCDEGWAGAPDGTIGHWRTLVPEPASSKPRPLDPDSLLRCFEQLCEEASPANERFRYVLALLLLQKRKLVISRNREVDGVQTLEVSGIRGEGPWDVPEQTLDDAEVESLQRDLNAWLATEWSPPE